MILDICGGKASKTSIALHEDFKNNEINVLYFIYITNKLRLILDVVYNKSIYFPIIYSYQKNI